MYAVQTKMRHCQAASGQEPPHPHTTCATQFRFLEWLASKIWSKQLVSSIRNTDFIGLRGLLNARGEIDGVAPQVIDKPPFADDARHDRSGVNSNPET